MKVLGNDVVVVFVSYYTRLYFRSRVSIGPGLLDYKSGSPRHLVFHSSPLSSYLVSKLPILSQVVSRV